MKRSINWPLAGLFVVAATLPVAAFINEFVFNRCTQAVLAEIGKEKPNFGCFEFFLNRYQTAIAAIAAVVAAGFTIAVTRQQTRTAVLANENVGRVYAYDALKSFILRAHSAIDEIHKFEAKSPRGTRSAGTPELELGGDKTAIAHLPPRIAKEVFLLERKTKGIRPNATQLREDNVRLVHIYERCALAVVVDEAEKLAREIGNPLGIFSPSFSDEIMSDLRDDARQIPSLDTGEAVTAWLTAEEIRRRKLP